MEAVNQQSGRGRGNQGHVIYFLPGGREHKQETGEFSCPLLAQTEKADQLAENRFFLGKLPVSSKDPVFLVILGSLNVTLIDQAEILAFLTLYFSL